MSSRSLLETLTPVFRNPPCSAGSPDSPKTRHPYPAPCFPSTCASRSRAPGRQAWPTGSAISAVIPARIPLSLSPFSLLFPLLFLFLFFFPFSSFSFLFSPSLFSPLPPLPRAWPAPSPRPLLTRPRPPPGHAALGPSSGRAARPARPVLLLARARPSAARRTPTRAPAARCSPFTPPPGRAHANAVRAHAPGTPLSRAPLLPPLRPHCRCAHPRAPARAERAPTPRPTAVDAAQRRRPRHSAACGGRPRCHVASPLARR